DFDTIFNEGDTPGNITENIFIAADTSDQPAVARFLTWRDFVPLYYEELDSLMATTFSPGELFPIFDRLLTGLVPQSTINNMKTFATNRQTYVKSVIPRNLSVFTNTLTLVNGYYTTNGSTVALRGLANVIKTRTVRVNGNPAGWNPVSGQWTNTVTLLPGFNRILIQAFDGGGAEFERMSLDIIYDDSTLGTVPQTISSDMALTVSGGPYEVTTLITVDAISDDIVCG